jgi:hypothetical protein
MNTQTVTNNPNVVLGVRFLSGMIFLAVVLFMLPKQLAYMLMAIMLASYLMLHKELNTAFAQFAQKIGQGQ